MIARGACGKAVGHCETTASQPHLLGFLYCTRTIQQRTYTRVSRGNEITKGNEQPHTRTFDRPAQGVDPFERSPTWQRDGRDDGLRPRRTPKHQFDKSPKWGEDGERPVKATVWRQLNLGDETRKEDGPRRDSYTRRDSSARASDHVPFETIDSAEAADIDLEGSTITPTERKAFEKLFSIRKERDAKAGQKLDNDGTALSKKRKPEQESSLDAILDAAVNNLQPRERPPPQLPAALRPMAEKARERQRSAHDKMISAGEAREQAAIKQDLARIPTLMDQANTDVELWSTLENLVLNRLVATGIDPITTPRQHAAVEAWRQTQSVRDSQRNPAKTGIASDLPVMTANLPAHLLHFMQVAQSSFPASMLSLNLLPTLKKLGPSAFALGATTSLYNAHMRTLYRKYDPAHSLHAISLVLREMDREVYEFDEETLAIVLLAIKDARRFRRGYGGPALEALWKTESVNRGVKSMLVWRDVVEEKRQEVALRRAREEEAIKQAALEEAEENEEENREAVATMAGGGYVFNYQTCSVSELQAFISARTGREPSTGETKQHYIQGLRELDHQARFRFFELAPELRNLIYRNLLGWDDADSKGRSFCYPQILATCKQAHREAKDLIYTVRISVEVRERYTTCSAIVGRTFERELVDTACLEAVGWGAHLRDFAQLAVVIDVEMEQGRRSSELSEAVARRVNNLLYSLTNHLAGSDTLKNVDVRMHGDCQHISQALYPRMLWPLKKFQMQGIAVSVVGVPAGVVEKSLEQPGSDAGVEAANIVQRYWQLEEEVKKHRIAGRDATNVSPAVGSAAQQLEDMALGCAYVDGEWEKMLVKAMRRLENALQDVWKKSSRARARTARVECAKDAAD